MTSAVHDSALAYIPDLYIYIYKFMIDSDSDIDIDIDNNSLVIKFKLIKVPEFDVLLVLLLMLLNSFTPFVFSNL